MTIRRPWRGAPKRAEARTVREVDAGGETLTLARLTLLTGKPKALRAVLDALRASGAVEVGIGHRARLGALWRAVRTAITHASTTGSIATIDTVEIGVHYTDLERWIAQIHAQGRKHTVQVLATTQSAETVAALARVACDSGADAADIVLVKCGTGLPRAPVLDPKAIMNAAAQQVETR